MRLVGYFWPLRYFCTMEHYKILPSPSIRTFYALQQVFKYQAVLYLPNKLIIDRKNWNILKLKQVPDCFKYFLISKEKFELYQECVNMCQNSPILPYCIHWYTVYLVKHYLVKIGSLSFFSSAYTQKIHQHLDAIQLPLIVY